MSEFSALPDLTSKQQWYAKHIDTANQQGMKLAAYARKHNISVKGIHNANGRLSKIRQSKQDGTGTGKFLAVGSLPPKASMTHVELTLPNGCLIKAQLNQQSFASFLTSAASL